MIELHLSKFKDIYQSDKLLGVFRSLSILEKIIFIILLIVFISSSLNILLKLNEDLLVEVPKYGGELSEGVIGTPRFINPVLAISETDRDLSSLIYSGLMRFSKNGELIPDLAESYSVSEDGLRYTFKIRDDAYFHDGEKVEAEDIIYTISLAQDPSIKSPRRANWDGVSVEEINEKEIVFNLKQPYPAFIYNTTIGILPKHIWQNISIEEFQFSSFNTNPIGSGPYKVKSVEKDETGITLAYLLTSFKDFTLGRPYIDNVNIKFYKNDTALSEALDNGDINSANSVSPEIANNIDTKKYVVETSKLPRTFGIFFNQSQAPILASKEIRKALNLSVDRQKIVDEVLGGYGDAISSPIPKDLLPYESISNEESSQQTDKITEDKEQAKTILENAGFKISEDGYLAKETKDGQDILSFSITTANVPELVKVAESVIEDWKELGADVSLRVFPINDLTQQAIRPRRYDSLLFGQVISRDLDFYAFWHSSQRNDPGLNIADYANITVDNALEKARTSNDEAIKIENLRGFESEIVKENPAIFIYSPKFIYILPQKLHADIPESITTPSERFLNIYSWYIETNKVWKIFKK